MSGSWRIKTLGDFRLENLCGAPVRLPTAKVEALLVVLAAHRTYGISRDELAAAVWPSKPLDASRASLRQALAQLRSVLGAEALLCTRNHCRLSEAFSLTTDLDAADDRRNFMPGHDGAWFAEMRLLAGSESHEPSVVEHFLETLEWYAARSPRNMYALMRANPALVRGVRLTTVLQLVEDAGTFNEWLGWEFFWKGSCEEDLEFCAKLLRHSLNHARHSGDLDLASEACLELGKVYTRTGRFERADRICKIASDLASKTSSATVWSNRHRLLGTVLVQQTAGRKGFEHLRRSEDLIEDPVERAILQSARALFEASAGQLHNAERTLRLFRELEEETGHSRLRSTASLTRCLIKAQTGGHEEAIAGLETVADPNRTNGSVQITVYANELLARLHSLRGDRTRAQRNTELARAGRSESRMAVTPLEALRVQIVR